MPAVTRYQLNVASQTNYTNAVTSSITSLEVVGYGPKPVHARVPSKSLRAGHPVMRTDREQPYKVGGAGAFDFEVATKGFAFWLPHMFGTSSSSATATNGTTHSATILTTTGRYFTAQVNYPYHPADTDSAFTFTGGKVLKWSAECKVDEPLTLHVESDFYDYSTNVSLTASSYATSFNLLTFVDGTVTVGGTSVNVREFKVEVDNGFEPDKERYIRNESRKLEPQQRKHVQVSCELLLDWSDLTQFNRFAAATASGLLAEVIATFEGPTTINSGSVTPYLKFTIPNLRIDEALPNDVSGPDPLEQPVKGVGLYDGTSSAISAIYIAEDAG